MAVLVLVRVDDGRPIDDTSDSDRALWNKNKNLRSG